MIGLKSIITDHKLSFVDSIVKEHNSHQYDHDSSSDHQQRVSDCFITVYGLPWLVSSSWLVSLGQRLLYISQGPSYDHLWHSYNYTDQILPNCVFSNVAANGHNKLWRTLTVNSSSVTLQMLWPQGTTNCSNHWAQNIFYEKKRNNLVNVHISVMRYSPY